MFAFFSCTPLVCLSASCLPYSLDVVRYDFMNKTNKMFNNTQNLSGSNARFGLKDKR